MNMSRSILVLQFSLDYIKKAAIEYQKVYMLLNIFPPLLCSLADPTNQVPNGVIDGREKGEGPVMTLV